MFSKLDDALRLNTLALSLRGTRSQVLASNIANADTPHFLARDFDFPRVMQDTLAGRQPGVELSRSAAAHLPSRRSEPNIDLKFSVPTQASIDGNSVELDVERAKFSDNAVRYEAGLTFLSGQLKSLLAAVQG